MTRYEIPLTAEPQAFDIALAGVTYNLSLAWNVPAQCWILDIADRNNVPLVDGISVVTGADLLEQYGYLAFGGRLIAETDGDLSLPPSFTNLGKESHVIFEAGP